MNLQGFIKQPRINGRQARWLIYLTLYDFIIRHRPGILNPVDGLSRRPDYFLSPAGEIASQSQGSLQNRLVGLFPNKETGPELPLQDAVRCRDTAIQLPLQDAVKCRDTAVQLLLQDAVKCRDTAV